MPICAAVPRTPSPAVAALEGSKEGAHRYEACRRSKELEKKMKEVDDAIVMFQRPKVYVAE
jgi:hypothetical protein